MLGNKARGNEARHETRFYREIILIRSSSNNKQIMLLLLLLMIMINVILIMIIIMIIRATRRGATRPNIRGQANR